MAKTFLAVLAAIGLLFTLQQFTSAETAATTDTTKLPPVEQPLVREGDFAFALAQALNLGGPRSEAEAEEMLALAGIAPESGWISDYPVTPAVIGDIRAAVRKAATEGRIKLDMAEADKVVIALTEEFGLPAMAGLTDTPVSEAVAETSPATTYDEAALTEYYTDYGPPAITYYEPPYSYGYLYDYVYDPFWCSGFHFPGYYILQNFTIVVNVDKHGKKWRDKDWVADGGAGRDGRGGRGGRGDRDRADGSTVVSNRVVDPATGQPKVVDTATREVVAIDTERSRREARRDEWRSGRIAEDNPDRAGFRRARAEGRDVFGRGRSDERTTGSSVVTGEESGIRALQRELSRGEGRGDRRVDGLRDSQKVRPAREQAGRDDARLPDAPTRQVETTGGGRTRERAATGDDGSRRLTGGGSGRGSSASRESSSQDDRPMSVRGWTYGTTGGDGRPDSERSYEPARQSGRPGGIAADTGINSVRVRESGGNDRVRETFSGDGDRSRNRERELNTNTGYTGRGRDSAPSASGGGIPSGRSFERAAPMQSAPAMQAAPSYAPSAPSRDFGARGAPSGGGSSGRSERAFSSPGHGGDRGGGGREWSGGGRGGGERDGGHDRGGGRGGGSCRGRNC